VKKKEHKRRRKRGGESGKLEQRKWGRKVPSVWRVWYHVCCTIGDPDSDEHVGASWYTRLFSPLGSDDARHDEALASRIAALNMLDLSLDHLGLITRPEDEGNPGALATGLSSLVASIGDELQNLITPSCLTPRAKAEVLINAHKLVVGKS
jgi:hypothetical protein